MDTDYPTLIEVIRDDPLGLGLAGLIALLLGIYIYRRLG